MSGPFGSSQWMYASGGFYNGVATQSVRLDDGSSAYLSRTPSSAGNRKTWTWSAWVKRGNILGADSGLFGADASGSSNESVIEFDGNDKLKVRIDGSEHRITTQVFRDSSAWYHIVVVFDTTEATANNRMKIYLNGTQITSFATIANLSQNADATSFNNANIHTIGRWANTANFYFDGYMAEVNFVDGLALDASYFGETKNGVWIAKEYTGSYGTNGFRLQFNQTGTGSASSSTIGADTSGNDNHWTSSGIVASDCSLLDSPENNFATLNPLFATGVTNTFSEGNLKVATSSSGRPSIPSTFVMPTGTGKWFFEARVSGNGGGVGIMRTDAPYNNDFYYGDYQWSVYDHSIAHNGASVGSLTGSASYPEVYGLMLDTDTDTLKVYVGGSEVGSFSVDAGYDYYAISGDGSGAVSITSQFNFGQDSTFQGNETAGGNVDANGIGDFSMTVPTGALALCTANLPEPTISPNADTQADDHFTTITRNGFGSSGGSITCNFQPDFVWEKTRSAASSHTLWDAVRGLPKALRSDSATAEVNQTWLTSFNSNGLTFGTNDYGTSVTLVEWLWKASNASSVTNTNGSITSNVSANTDAGFSIVKYTGNGSGTIGHGLGVTPAFFLIKNLDVGTYNWNVWHKTFTGGQVIYLNLTNARNTDTNVWNNTLPTSTVISVDNVEVNNSGDEHIAYCFAEIEGYSKFGSYTGNGSADGTFVYTGFRPAWIMMKDASEANSWAIYDTKRDTFNLVDSLLQAHDLAAEATYGGIDYTANGFKFRSSVNALNKSSNNYIYMAFAENPFKYANAR